MRACVRVYPDPDQVAVECLNFGMFPAINFALPPSWAKADFAGYIGRRALPLGVALPARSPADLTQTRTQTQTREPNASEPGPLQDRQARRARQARPEGGGGQHTQACLPALPAYLTYLGLLACRFFFPPFAPQPQDTDFAHNTTTSPTNDNL